MSLEPPRDVVKMVSSLVCRGSATGQRLIWCTRNEWLWLI